MDGDQQTEIIPGRVAPLFTLSRPGVKADAFQSEFLGYVMAQLDGVAAAIWFSSGESLRLRYQVQIPEHPKLQCHAGLLKRVIETSSTGRFAPGWSAAAGFDPRTVNQPTSTDADAPANHTEFEIVAAAASVIGGQSIVLEVYRPYSEFFVRDEAFETSVLQVAAEYAADRIRYEHLTSSVRQQAQLANVDRFAQQVHRSLEPAGVACVIANEVRSLVDCNRVAVGIRTGDTVQIAAISGTANVNRRSNSVRRMETLSSQICSHDKAIIISPNHSDCPDQFQAIVDDYLEHNKTKTFFAVPLRPNKDDQHALAVLLVEDGDGSKSPAAIANRLNLITGHSTTALSNAIANDRVFLKTARARIGQATQRGSGLRRLLMAMLLVGIVITLAIVPMSFRIPASGTLRALNRRAVFAAESGIVREVMVDHGQKVEAGQPILRLESASLQLELQQANEQLVSVSEKLHSKTVERSERGLSHTRQIQLDGEIVELAETERYLQVRTESLDERLKSMTIPSPITGIVGTWAPKDTLRDRPVQQGNLLLQLMKDDGQWEIEIHVDEQDAAPVLTAWQSDDEPTAVEFMLATHADKRFSGTLTDVARRTNTINNRHVLVAKVRPDDDHSGVFYDGSEVKVKILCGERSVGYVAFREVIDFFHSQILFYF